MISRDVLTFYKKTRLSVDTIFNPCYTAKCMLLGCPTIASIFDPCYSAVSFKVIMRYIGYLFSNYDSRYGSFKGDDGIKDCPQRFLIIYGGPASGKTVTQNFIVELVDNLLNSTPETEDIKNEILESISYGYEAIDEEMLKLKTGIITTNMDYVSNPCSDFAKKHEDIVYTSSTAYEADKIIKATGRNGFVYELIPREELEYFIELCMDIYSIYENTKNTIRK